MAAIDACGSLASRETEISKCFLRGSVGSSCVSEEEKNTHRPVQPYSAETAQKLEAYLKSTSAERGKCFPWITPSSRDGAFGCQAWIC